MYVLRRGLTGLSHFDTNRPPAILCLQSPLREFREDIVVTSKFTDI